MAEQPDNANPLRLVIDNAIEAAPVDDESPATGGPPIGGDGEPLPRKKLPPDAPFQVLGMEGRTIHLLDEIGQHIAEGPRDLGRNEIARLCGRKQDWLYGFAPRFSKAGKLDGFRSEVVADAIAEAAARKGSWNADERVRGRGAWLCEDGGLIWHAGDRVLLRSVDAGQTRDEWRDPGVVGEHVYPTGSPILRPWPTPVAGGSTGPAAELQKLFGTWWAKHPACMSNLLLGWLGAALLGGAIDWRPVLWITGDAGTGKSTLLKTIKGLLGAAVLNIGDATAAGLWQRLGHASLPVMLDEFEAGEDDRRAQGLLRLIRNASSGSEVLRGGADHKGAGFTLRNCYLASSVLPPAMGKTERSRIGMIELLELGRDQKPPDLRPDRLRDLGRKLLRRLIDGWPRWNDTLELYRAACARAGYSSRGAEVYGTMLAAADLLAHDAEVNADYADTLVSELGEMAAAGADEMTSDQERCLQHLLTSLLPPDGPNRRSVGHWVGEVCDCWDALEKDAARLPLNSGDPDKIERGKMARQNLGSYGLKIASDERDGRRYLYVANTHSALARLFQGTKWAGQAGASSVWRQSLARLPEAVSSGKTVRFDKAATSWATQIPIERVYEPDGAMAATARPEGLPNDD